MNWEAQNNPIAAINGFGNNEIIRSEDKKHYISYNPWCPDSGNKETAICIHEPWECFILYGDHREGYTPIVNDLEACKQYFKDHQEQISFTSDTVN